MNYEFKLLFLGEKKGGIYLLVQHGFRTILFLSTSLHFLDSQ